MHPRILVMKSDFIHSSLLSNLSWTHSKSNKLPLHLDEREWPLLQRVHGKLSVSSESSCFLFDALLEFPSHVAEIIVIMCCYFETRFYWTCALLLLLNSSRHAILALINRVIYYSCVVNRYIIVRIYVIFLAYNSVLYVTHRVGASDGCQRMIINCFCHNFTAIIQTCSHFI